MSIEANNKPAAYKIFDPSVIIALRKEKGLTFTDIAEQCGSKLSEDTIRFWISKRTKPHPENLEAVAKVFGVDAKSFFKPVNGFPLDPENKEFVDAFDLEASAEFSEAIAAYHTLDSGKYCRELREAARKRIRMNRFLAEEVRKLHAPSARASDIPYYESPERLRAGKPAGYLPKYEIHRQGKLHHTCLVILTLGEAVAYYIRARWQQSAGKYDFFGGHSIKGEKPAKSANREVREEVHIYVGRDRIQKWAFGLKKVGMLEYNLDGKISENGLVNREISTLFVGRLPVHPALKFVAYDDYAQGTDIGVIPEENFLFDSLQNLVAKCRRSPQEFADGAQRVLTRCDSDVRFAGELERLLQLKA